MERALAGRALRAGFLCLAVSCLSPFARAEAAQPPAPEPAGLAAAVEKGDLPPLKERLPEAPRVMPVDSACPAAELGGTLNMLGGSAKDTRMMPVYGYARLVGYDETYDIVPDIAESYTVEEGRIFTFHLRPGMKWSDGAPFTAEDFRYFWEDMAKNPAIAKFGVPVELLVDGEEPDVTFPDAYTVRYAWSKPNPNFLAALAAANPFEIFRPAHYLKKYHERYQKPDKLEAMVKKSGQRNWAALHFKKDRAQRNDNPDLPTIEPWMLVSEMPSERLIFKRNPYFFRVDQEGRQLPYIDEVALTISNSALIPAKVANGEADLQAAYLAFPNYPFLKRGEKRSHYEVRRWESGRGSHVALYPNLNAADPVWREVIRQADFRRALSLAINRDDINKAIFYGLAQPGNNTVLPDSPLFEPEFRTKWARYDTAAANQLLDKLGYKMGPDGLRLLPDGREMRIVVETAGEGREQSDVLQLVRDDWRKIGIDLLLRESQREIFRNRIKAGSTLISVWTGLDNGLPNQATDPSELAPATAEQLQWPGFGMWVETGGTGGEAPDADDPDLVAVRRLIALRKEWRETLDPAKRTAIWKEMLEISANQVFTIGIVSGVDQIVVVADNLENVPERGVYNFDPGGYFGIYHPDTFFFACPGVDTAEQRP
ncbi:ABC transporter substrate-binding protein [Aurantimonas sp. VKM B-3413]|uniref:ABC transporter substrate-binding protein n=1 Tax=Aurantimonas sp. VKM B-3413 TaxID=2779401 RepID=UPI001E2DFC60|nr:ABC transporter substrate-binding protein [Aurantimonas sp. VKM B-3413]MCB8836722.1 ABC transporter substrate-binding protein [Aurantimonas sp. VKM B-3413]